MEPGGASRSPRWRFANAVFDEGGWTLTVAGKRVAIETKPLELLRELLHREGALATKDQLLDALWPDVSVVEASLTTAMLKLRRALGDDARDGRIIETVQRRGYRLAVPVTREGVVGGIPTTRVEGSPRRRSWRIAVGALALAAGGGALTAAWRSPPGPTQQEALDALNTLDTPRIRTMLAAGWKPDTPFDDQGNGALNTLLATCEWNPGHDHNRLMLVARLLIDHGASVAKRNVWGDTAYSIARAKRYCGPDHPVTQMIRGFCFSGLTNSVSDKCLASYEIRRRDTPPNVTPPAGSQVTASR